MIRYYNGDKFLGYLVVTCPVTGKPVVVSDSLEYFTPNVITHKKIGDEALDERVRVTDVKKVFKPYTYTLT